jgi:hypothetical protein
MPSHVSVPPRRLEKKHGGKAQPQTFAAGRETPLDGCKQSRKQHDRGEDRQVCESEKVEVRCHLLPALPTGWPIPIRLRSNAFGRR